VGGNFFLDQRTYVQAVSDSAAPERPGGPLAELVELIGDGALPLVADMDPYLLGATPSAFGRAGEYGKRDPYVPRTQNDVDARLAQALGGDRMVLVVGPSKAGKTRTLFEAVRHVAPPARLLAPLPGVFAQIAAHPEYRQIRDQVVLWLDDLDRFLIHADPLTPALLARLRKRDGPTVVVATLRAEAWERLHRDAGALNRDTRMLLEQAAEIQLTTTSKDPAERAAAARAYPNVRLDAGLGAELAGAPALLRRYENTRSGDPLQRAVIEVVIDWARVGRPGPIAEPVLAELAADRFRSRCPELVVTEAHVADAIRVARTPSVGTGGVAPLATSLLGDQVRGYRPFDYLVAADDGQTHTPRPIPEGFWENATREASPDDLFAIGVAAHQGGHMSEAVKAFRLAAHAGRTDAMYALGVEFAYYCKPRDVPAAHNWWVKAAAARDTNAMTALGVLSANQWDPDLPSARAWYEKAAAGGNPVAMYNLGVLFGEQWDPPDLPQARAWYEKAAAADNTNAMYNLGVLFGEQWDPPDLPAARAWYEKAAAAGDTRAMYNLGVVFTKRWDPPDLPRARDWWEKAAAGGDTGAMYNLGALFAEGWNPPDLPAARRWFEAAAAAGDVGAMYSLGVLLTKLWHPPDLPAACYWYDRAAAAGNRDAMIDLAVLLAARSDSADESITRNWFNKVAARLGGKKKAR
jgi:hypothetical protein